VKALVGVKARFGPSVLRNVRPPTDRRHDVSGRCVVCGANTTFVFNSWVVPPKQFVDVTDRNVLSAYQRRESLFCRSCSSSQRVRRIAEVLIDLYGNGAGTFAELVKTEPFRSCSIAEINAIGSVGAFQGYLDQLPGLAFSEYRGAEHLGEMVDGARNEDICNLTYPDASFDIVLSSDTLEHIPDFSAALRETLRVLRPGGRHIFTVPVVASRPKTFARAEIGPDDVIVHHSPPLFHGRGAGLFRYLPAGDDLLAYTEFGGDISDHLRKAGFEPEVFGGDDGDTTGATLVFSARAPEKGVPR
jgi:SAM-dependent methyltransferase